VDEVEKTYLLNFLHLENKLSTIPRSIVTPKSSLYSLAYFKK